MIEEEKDYNVFVLSWDNTGLESVIDVTQIEKETTWGILANRPSSQNVGQIIHHLLMRARYNSQRHYEIYSVRVEPNVSADDLRVMFEETPQEAADLIRERGNKIHSDRAKKSEIKIV